MMLFSNLPLLMVATFLLLTLVVGLYYSRKVASLREYAIGNKQFATATLVATTLATGIGAPALVSIVQEVYNQGLCWVIVMPLTAFSYWLIRPLASRMGPFMQHLSMAETLGAVYGRHLRIITASVCILASIVYISVQIKIMSMAIGICIHNIDASSSKYVIITATLILIFYAMCGGIRAVTFTDILQFITFTIVIPFLTWFIFIKTNKSISDIISVLQSKTKFQFGSVFTWGMQPIVIIALLLTCLFSAIEPPIMQRVYMSSSPMQAKKVFGYCTVFSSVICICIVLIGLFTFVSSPDLQTEGIWDHIIKQIPSPFKGFVAISLLAMAMSTADSNLNSCSVMISHDILEPIQKKTKIVSLLTPLWLARLTVIVVGISAMVVVFHYDNVYELMLLAVDWYIPMVLAPYILAIYGFRGASYTAIIGILTGALTILVWNQWIRPKTGIEGSFFSMLANGLAMLATYYLLPQPSGRNWVAPDKIFQQKKQEKARIVRRNKKARNKFFSKEHLAKLKLNATTLVLIGAYIMLTTLANICYCYYSEPIVSLWIFLPFFILGVGYVGYMPFLHSKKGNSIPDWIIGKYYFLSLLCCLPLHLLISCALSKEILWPLALFFMHGAVLLWTLPLYWSVRGLLIAGGSMMLIYWYKGNMLCPSIVLCLPLLGIGLLMLILIFYFKYQTMIQQDRISYFQDQQKLKEAYKLKSIAYALELPILKKTENKLEIEGDILEQAIQNVTQSISFSDEFTPFYKEDFQTIVHKFSEWATYLKQRAKSQAHALLQSSTIDLDDLIDAIEVAYEKEHDILPGLWVEKAEVEGAIPSTLIGDREQLVELLTMAIAHVAKNTTPRSIITLQLHTTHLQYKKSEPLEEGTYPSLMVFSAIALLISHEQADQNAIPKVERIYGDDIEDHTKPHSNANLQTQLDLKKQKMERIVRAHYGYMALPNPDAILLVIPRDVTQIKEEMLAASLPREAGTSETDNLTPKEQAESLTKLVDFHDWVCSTTMVEPAVISEILLLLRRCYGFKRHACGQLFYLRAVGIATWVVRWVGYHPKLIYAALLYDLVRYTRLPLSYIKASYNLGVLCFVENILSIDSRSELETSLLAVANRFKGALEKEQLSVLYVKLAERLYDLEHAIGYHHTDTVKKMAKESLTVDVQLAKRYLNPEIAAILERTASEAL